MIFKRFHIDGFGIWRDLTLDNLEPGLNVFVAPNEGGKTTLMSFTRAVLYGFRQRKHPERYSPLHGGKHGGYVEIQENGKLFRIVRTSDGSSSGALQVTDGDGKPLPEETLSKLLAGTTREVYENIFAFGLAELQRIETMRNEEVAAHIYSAGMAAAGTDPLGFRARLDEARREYFLKRGKKQHVPRLANHIQALQRDIEPLQQLPEEHGRLLKQQKTLSERLATVDGELDGRQRERDAARRARSAWGDYEELLAAESALEALGVPLEEASAGEATDLLTETESAVLQERGRIRSMLASSPRLRELRASADKHGADADSAESALESHLTDLGHEWDVDRILSTEAGLKQRETAREYAGELREIESEIESMAARAGEAHDAYEAIINRRDPVSREAVMLTWGVGAVVTFLSAVLMPVEFRLMIASAVGTAGAIAGIVAFWLRYRGRQQHNDDRLASAEREETRWAQHEIAEGSLRDKEQEWKKWLKKAGLNADLTLDGALDLLDQVREAQEVARQRETASAGQQSALEELSVACGRVNALLTDLGRDPVPLDDKLLEAVEPLVGQLETLQAELDSVEDQHLRIRKEMQQYVQARAALRASAGEEGIGGLRARLESLDPDQIRRLLDDAETAVSAMLAQRDGINEQLGGVAERIAHLEGDAELGELLLDREQARSELVSAIGAWAEQTTAATLFDLAKKVYEEERQPEILRLASEYFSTMTRNAYTRVLAPLGEIDLQVEATGSGNRKGPEALSQGTKEQLYLAMRLALASVYADQLVALPLVADDILVNFDDDRAEATAALLGTYAADGHQVLAFTCHRRLAELFIAQAPDARVIELPKPK